jgi:hypothetical protein
MVGLCPAQRHHQAVALKVEIADVETHQFGATKGAGEAEQEDGAVAQATECLRRGGQHGLQIVGEDRRDWRWALPWLRRTPASTSRTTGSTPGGGKPATLCSRLMATRRRSMLAGLSPRPA